MWLVVEGKWDNHSKRRCVGGVLNEDAPSWEKNRLNDLKDVLEDICVCPIFDPNTDHHDLIHEPCAKWHHCNVHCCCSKANGLMERKAPIKKPLGEVAGWLKGH